VAVAFSMTAGPADDEDALAPGHVIRAQSDVICAAYFSAIRCLRSLSKSVSSSQGC